MLIYQLSTNLSGIYFMKIAIIVGLLLAPSLTQAPAIAGQVDSLLYATSDTTKCKLVKEPDEGTLIKKGYVISKSKKITLDVWDVPLENTTNFFYVLKENGKVKTNFQIAYERSKKNPKVHQPAFGWCGGSKTERLLLIVGNKVRYQQQLGGFGITQNVGPILTFNNPPQWQNFALESNQDLPAKK